jgi:hypothetical protein
MSWGVYSPEGNLIRKFKSCGSAHRWLIREGLEWSAYEIRTLRGEWIMNPYRKMEDQK